MRILIKQLLRVSLSNFHFNQNYIQAWKKEKKNESRSQVSREYHEARIKLFDINGYINIQRLVKCANQKNLNPSLISLLLLLEYDFVHNAGYIIHI